MKELLLSRLNTEKKDNIVNAVNEVNTKISNHAADSSLHMTPAERDRLSSINDGSTTQKGVGQLNDEEYASLISLINEGYVNP